MLEHLPDVVGLALRDQRAGLDKIAFNQVNLRQGAGALTVASLAFTDHAPIPADYTADGAGVSPPLQWTGVPPQAASVVVIVEDADAPTPQPLVHAIVVGLDGANGSLAPGALPSPGHDPMADVTAGRNSYLQASWLPPDPPPGHGTHRYVFQVFALEAGARLDGTPGRSAVLDALREHGLAGGYLVGTYERPDGAERVAQRATVTAPLA
ncbi:YbhB/YbcL family Raf kinase inhibitor-like protein [Rhizobacter sp. Root1221]|uniref:YbhB/YbcL family Raf kinase inhibitor-like protein n=1 Tax=Rhizobacter sp. Root1221 TaxID=1736433 RepID=UPI0006F5BB63|nr:YbhB/YbcL family Raf kinase inhibitor-like protein [Rhizobacter sp. Root1221]KQV86726.1 phosphatidylethanolamine-binding protein [Rhizobacter sp. Root1221]